MSTVFFTTHTDELGKARRAGRMVLATSALVLGLSLCAPAFAQDTSENPVASFGPETEGRTFDNFEFASDTDVQELWSNSTKFDWQSEGGRWGFVLEVEEGTSANITGALEDNPIFETEELRAGAFVNVGDRFRFGGHVRFSSPDLPDSDPLIEEHQPEVKFESALRF